MQSGQSNPADGVDLRQLGEAEGGENGQTVQVESATNLLEIGGGEGSQSGHIVGNEICLNHRHTCQVDIVGGAAVNGDAALDGRTAGQGHGVAGVLEGHGASGLSALSCSP